MPVVERPSHRGGEHEFSNFSLLDRRVSLCIRAPLRMLSDSFSCVGFLNRGWLCVCAAHTRSYCCCYPCRYMLLLLLSSTCFRLPISSSGTAWRDLKKHHVRAYKKAFPSYLTVDDIGQALERLNIR